MKICVIAVLFFLTACAAKKKIVQEPTSNRMIQIQTELGNINILLSDSTPLHRNNFITLVKEKFYDSLLFHRIIQGFMIQGGDPNSKYAQPGVMLGNGGKPYRVPAEFNVALFHKRGVLAAARDDNPEKASSSCQFYIVQGKKWTDAELDATERTRLGGRKIPDSIRTIYKTIGGTPQLDMGYTVFGAVTEGLDVLDKIAARPKDRYDRPLQDVRMKIVILH